MDYLGGRGSKQTWRSLVRNVNSVDCSGDSKVWTELGSNNIKVIVLDDQKSRELRRIRTTCSAVYLYDAFNRNNIQTAVTNMTKQRMLFKNLWLKNMRCFVMFVTVVCILFLFKLKWPKNKSFYDVFKVAYYSFEGVNEPNFKVVLWSNFCPLIF